jgi:hypothetical protein
MAKNKAGKIKSPKDQLFEILTNKPPIYKDAVKRALLCLNGVSAASLIADLNSMKD